MKLAGISEEMSVVAVVGKNDIGWIVECAHHTHGAKLLTQAHIRSARNQSFAKQV